MCIYIHGLNRKGGWCEYLMRISHTKISATVYLHFPIYWLLPSSLPETLWYQNHDTWLIWVSGECAGRETEKVLWLLWAVPTRHVRCVMVCGHNSYCSQLHAQWWPALGSFQFLFVLSWQIFFFSCQLWQDFLTFDKKKRVLWVFFSCSQEQEEKALHSSEGHWAFLSNFFTSYPPLQAALLLGEEKDPCLKAIRKGLWKLVQCIDNFQ